MPSLLSYRIERILHENLFSKRSSCHLLAVHLYVEDIEQERVFYSKILGCHPQSETENSCSFTLADGLHLILAQTKKDDADSKPTLQPHHGQVELDLDTTELMSLWHSLMNSAVDRGKELFSIGKQQLLRVLSPTGLLLCLRQKIL